MDLAATIQQLVESLLKDEKLFVVEVLVALKRKPGKITVVLDGDAGVSVENCAEISRALSEMLDKSDLVDGNYNLEVSTPGLDQPLKLKRQYNKNIGRILSVKHAEETGVEEGKLILVTESEITLEQKSGKGKKEEQRIITIPFSSISKAFVTVSFN